MPVYDFTSNIFVNHSLSIRYYITKHLFTLSLNITSTIQILSAGHANVTIDGREDEDATVLRVIAASNEQPFTQWSDLAPQLPGRTGKQIRDRWVNYLNPAINHLPFSREDDLLLWNGHKELGKRWVEISVKKFNSTRSENHIKNRWYSAAFKKFIAGKFGPDAYGDAKTGNGDRKFLESFSHDDEGSGSVGMM